MARRRRCPVCKSRQWRKEPSSGVITCSEGHVLMGYRNETSEVTDFGPHAMRKRTLKSTRKIKGRQSKADSAVYYGDKARFHYFQCLQLLLRLQVQKLTELWKLPREFEVICRDVWIMHLTTLADPPPPEPLNAKELSLENEEGNAKKADKKGPEEDQRKYENKQNDDDDGGNPHPPSSSGSSSSSLSEAEDDEGEEDLADHPDIAELLRQNSESDGSGEDEVGRDGDAGPAAVSSRKKRKKWRRDDSPMACVAVLVYACWSLRVPVMYMDLIRLIDLYELPYLESIRLMPESLTRHLSKHTKQALSPHWAPTTVGLHGLTSEMAKKLFASYGMYVPELNAAPMLWRTVKYMGGNAVLYTMVKALGKLLELPLTLNPVMGAGLRKADGGREGGMYKGDNVPVEVSLVGTVVMTLKLVYGLDGRERHRDRWDPIFSLPALDEYLGFIEGLRKHESRKPQVMFSASNELCVLDMEEREIDEYLEMMEHALVQERRGDDVLDEYFPLWKKGQDETADEWPAGEDDEVVLTTRKTEEAGGSDGEVAGEGYAIYSAQDAAGTLGAALEQVMGLAASWVGVEAESIVSVVERLERRAQRWTRK